MNSGGQLFARYAYAPNRLGYCGPAESGALLGYGADLGPGDDIRQIARRFSGAWPYLEILAELTGVDDPLDHTVVKAYWLGGGLADEVDGHAFGRALLARIGPQAGHYWQHLIDDILDEAAPTHCFHVFGVYPWTRLLDTAGFEQPLKVLDNCRIRWGEVLAEEAEQLVVRSRRLTWSAGRLGLSEPQTERVTRVADGRTFVPDVRAGRSVALHWDWATDWLTDDDVQTLHRTTEAQLELTNQRLQRQRAYADAGTA